MHTYLCPTPAWDLTTLVQRQQLSQGSLKKKRMLQFVLLLSSAYPCRKCSLCTLCQSHVQKLHLVHIKRNFLLNTASAESISFTCCGTHDITPKIVHYFFSLFKSNHVGEKTYSYRQGAKQRTNRILRSNMVQSYSKRGQGK